MGVVVETIEGKIRFFEDRLVQWAAHAVQIGSTAPEITALQTLVTTARASLTTQGELQAAARAGTSKLNRDVEDMAKAGALVIAKVRVKGATDPSVYEIANIPSPATPSPVPPPGQPYKVGLQLDQTGAVGFTWRCKNPRGGGGTLYQIGRQIGGTGPFVIIGTTGPRAFTDSTLPASAATAGVTYQITAVRSTAKGPTAEFSIKFGQSGAGEMTATLVPSGGGSGGTPKLAA